MTDPQTDQTNGIITIAEWHQNKESPRKKHKITAQPNGEGWLILKQIKRNKQWIVQESYHSARDPTICGEFATELIGDE